MNETIHQTTSPSGLADEPTIPTTPMKSKTTSNFNVCSDYDFHVEEERKTLFPRQSSLSFPIEHYCMMVEKVYVSFLKAYREQYTSSSDTTTELERRNSILKTYKIGRRLQSFLNDVLPSHIHFHDNFEGNERIRTISVTVDEYLSNLSIHLEDERSTICLDSRNDSESYERNNERDMQSCDREEESKSHHTSQSVDNYFPTYDDDLFSVSTSYTIQAKLDWDDCECTGSVSGNGFILIEKSFEDSNEVNEIKAANQDVECFGDQDLLTGSELGYTTEATEDDDFKFSSLISHWKAQEQKWNK